MQTPVGRVLQQQLEALSRGLVAVTANTGVFISWRLFKSEVTGHNATGLTGTDFVLYKNGVRLATVTDSTNYLDAQGTSGGYLRRGPAGKRRRRARLQGRKAVAEGVL